MSRRALVSPDRLIGLGALVVAVLAPLIFSSFWVGALDRKSVV